MFADFQELGRVWTHPRAMVLAQIRRELKTTNLSDSENSLKDFIVDSDDNDDGVVCLDDSGEEKDSGMSSSFYCVLFLIPLLYLNLHAVKLITVFST